jgi:hypothetical protein
MKQARSLKRNLPLKLALGILIGMSSNVVSYAIDSQRADILDEILEHSGEELARGREPVMIFDLDDTIFDAGSRTLAILKSLSVDPELRDDFSGLEQKLSNLVNNDIHYDLSDNLDMLAITDKDLRDKATNYWNERFFLSCDLDAIHPRAKDFVLKSHAKGAHIVYLTGRDEPRMKDCTMESFRLNGLPVDERATLMLKPHKDLSDVEFKQAAFKTIEQLGSVIAGFDNEPANVNAMSQYFPQAEIIFIETRHSSRPDKPFPELEHLKWQVASPVMVDVPLSPADI